MVLEDFLEEQGSRGLASFGKLVQWHNSKVRDVNKLIKHRDNNQCQAGVLFQSRNGIFDFVDHVERIVIPTVAELNTHKSIDEAISVRNISGKRILKVGCGIRDMTNVPAKDNKPSNADAKETVSDTHQSEELQRTKQSG